MENIIIHDEPITNEINVITLVYDRKTDDFKKYDHCNTPDLKAIITMSDGTPSKLFSYSKLAVVRYDYNQYLIAKDIKLTKTTVKHINYYLNFSEPLHVSELRKLQAARVIFGEKF
jgi:hypothetical protein